MGLREKLSCWFIVPAAVFRWVETPLGVPHSESCKVLVKLLYLRSDRLMIHCHTFAGTLILEAGVDWVRTILCLEVEGCKTFPTYKWGHGPNGSGTTLLCIDG